MNHKNLSLTQVNTEQMTNSMRPKLTMKHKAYIFDIDGVLSDPKHRIEHAANKDWDKFHELSVHDNPFVDVCKLCNQLNLDYEVIFMTGRPEKFRDITLSWIRQYVFGNKNRQMRLHLVMRPDGDFRKSSDYKLSEYEKLKEDYVVIGVFEDNEHVVKMWREQGITCFALPSMYQE